MAQRRAVPSSVMSLCRLSARAEMCQIHQAGGGLTQVVLETHSATTAFNLSHAEEAPAEKNHHLDQRYISPGLVKIQEPMLIGTFSECMVCE